jgi:hypothetical protein|tara:strand:- start:409 stop:606 length:198 start_codon:yes stop_codon:yes gene_type:complete
MANLKILAPYIVIIVTGLVTWGSFSARLDEVEKKADNIAQIQQDIAVIKQEIVWMKAFLVENMDR